jgi:hypothetical protein
MASQATLRLKVQILDTAKKFLVVCAETATVVSLAAKVWHFFKIKFQFEYFSLDGDEFINTEEAMSIPRCKMNMLLYLCASHLLISHLSR